MGDLRRGLAFVCLFAACSHDAKPGGGPLIDAGLDAAKLIPANDANPLVVDESASSDDGSGPMIDDGGAVMLDDSGGPLLDATDSGDMVSPNAVTAIFVPAPPLYWYVDHRPLVVGVGGTDVTAYKYALDSDPFGAEVPVAMPITLTTIAPGLRTLKLIGRNAAGTWQIVPTTAAFHMVSPASEPTACTLKSAGGTCDLIVTAQKIYYTTPAKYALDGKPAYETVFDAKPGTRVCLHSGTLTQLELNGFIGSPDNPIVITNCGGQTNFVWTGAGRALGFVASRYFRVVGNGDAASPYGITIDTSGTQDANGLEAYKGSSDYEVAYVEIKEAAYAGIVTRTDVSCDLNRSTFAQDNTFLHHNYVHNTGGEGFYVGGSHWNSADKVATGQSQCGAANGNGTIVCDGVCKFEAELHGMRVHDNLVEDTIADGIQVSSAYGDNGVSDGKIDYDTEVYDNIVRRGCSGPSGFNSGGMTLQGGTTGNFYRNLITDTEGDCNGLFLAGPGWVNAYDNVIINVPGAAGMAIQDNNPATGNGPWALVNNTIVNPGFEGLYMYNQHSKNNQCHDNLIIGTKSGQQAIRLNSSMIDWHESNDVTTGTVTDHFVDITTLNAHLKSTSTAVNAGIDTSSYGVTTDYDKLPRNVGAYDCGAYEYHP